jgi:hypothetical protein
LSWHTAGGQDRVEPNLSELLDRLAALVRPLLIGINQTPAFELTDPKPEASTGHAGRLISGHFWTFAPVNRAPQSRHLTVIENRSPPNQLLAIHLAKGREHNV